MINNALDRIKQGSYGKCLKCGQEIPQERLEAIPYAFMCIQCQTHNERSNR
jgi:RNA polymerase-binding transcription factor DksA